MTLTFDTPETINAFRVVTLCSALTLEVKHPGMKANSKLNTINAARSMGYTGKQRKLDALVWVVELLLHNGMNVMPMTMQVLNDNGYELLADDNGETFID